MSKILTFRVKERIQLVKQSHTNVRILVLDLRTQKIVHGCICTSDSMVTLEVEKKDSPEAHELAILEYTAKRREHCFRQGRSQQQCLNLTSGLHRSVRQVCVSVTSQT